MTTDQETIDAIRELNAEIYDRSKLEYVNFYAKTDGQTWIIMFADICLWNDGDDDREQDPQTEEYEPLVPFLRRRAAEEISKLSSIWKNAESIHPESKP